MRRVLCILLSATLLLGCLSGGLSAYAEETIVTGETKTVTIAAAGEAVTYRFTPEESGLYVFYTTGDEDTFGYFTGTVAYSDDNAYDGRNFFISRNIPAGTACTIKVKLNDKTKTGSFSLTVIKSEAASVELEAGSIRVDEYTGGREETSLVLNRKFYCYSLPQLDYSGVRLLVKDAQGELVDEISIKGLIDNSGFRYFIDGTSQKIDFLSVDEGNQYDVPWEADKANVLELTYLNMFTINLPVTVSHVYSQEYDVAATCTDCGYHYGFCSKCKKEIKSNYTAALGHDFGEWQVTQAPTAGEAGTETRTCSRCDATQTRECAALGVNLTVKGSQSGYVTGSVTTAADGSDVTENLAYGESYSLKANGSYFIGWAVNGKITSQNRVYTGVAYTDIVIEPVFGADTAGSYSVCFYDKYGNLVAAHTALKKEDFAALEVPNDVKVQVPGFRFKSWSDGDIYTAEQIRQRVLTASYWAIYEKNSDAPLFTVTSNAGDVSVPYGTAVTLEAPEESEWLIGGTVLGYGATFTVPVTADMTVLYRTRQTAPAPAVAVAGKYLVSGTKWQYNAVKYVPEGFEVIDQGFVYGKNMSENDLQLANEGKTGAGGYLVKVKRFGAGSEAYSLQYSAGTGTACVRAFMTVRSADNVITTVYSDTVMN